MNFDPVGIDSKGMYYVKFKIPLYTVERINLLERWILVQSFAYYELDENIAADSVYDAGSEEEIYECGGITMLYTIGAIAIVTIAVILRIIYERR